ncbi:MAG: response regulator [Rhodobacteraceae bacterium]|nr:response regulator [Paracoccaceae bacterium]
MSNTLEQLPRRLVPTPMRPLLGLTILVVEDSRFASEAVRQMCLHSGARIRRADCLASARRHLAAYCPSVTLVDLTLPDGSGCELIRELRAQDTIAPVIATSGLPDGETLALEAGAQGFLPKPLAGLAVFQQTILAQLPPEARPRGPRPVLALSPEPDKVALRDDLDHARRLLTGNPAPDVLDYVARFLESVGHSACDTEIADWGRRLGQAHCAEKVLDLEALDTLLKKRIGTVPVFEGLTPTS